MSKIYLILLFSFSLFANDSIHKFAPSSDCKKCHTQIYNEFKSSMHANTTPDKDVIHKAIWDKHPANKKLNRYICGKCHTPAANNLDKMLTKGEKAMPDVKNATHQEAISCAYCHRIKAIKEGKGNNTNIISTKEKSYYSNLKNSIKSPYHTKQTDSDLMKTANVCMGCHSHEVNKDKLLICSAGGMQNSPTKNCITCHMPKVRGTVSSLNKRDKHAFHGFAGSHTNSKMLAQYVDLSIQKNTKDFVIHINNKANHSLLMHPLRVAILKISVKRGTNIIKLKKEVFVRVIGKDGKPAMPWVANTTLKDTMIHANEKRSVKREFKLQKEDIVNVELGWFLVNPKAVKKLGLASEDIATKFHSFKKQSFKF